MNDPSGHRECESAYSMNCGFMKPRNLAVTIKLLNDFGVTLSGDWTLSKSYSIYLGVSATAEILHTFTNSNSENIFRHAFGPMEFELSNDLGGWWGLATDGKIQILAGIATPRLVVHELGHSFEKHIWIKNGGIYYGTNNPIQLLGEDGIYDVNGNLVTGRGTRNNNLAAPYNGYYSDIIPDQFHARQKIDGDNSFEDWADMFMNWVDDLFYPNDAGQALSNWINVNMVEWLP